MIRELLGKKKSSPGPHASEGNGRSLPVRPLPLCPSTPAERVGGPELGQTFGTSHRNALSSNTSWSVLLLFFELAPLFFAWWKPTGSLNIRLKPMVG